MSSKRSREEHIRETMRWAGWCTPAVLDAMLKAQGVYCTSYMSGLRVLRRMVREEGGDILKRPMPNRSKGSKVCEYLLISPPKEGVDHA